MKKLTLADQVRKQIDFYRERKADAYDKPLSLLKLSQEAGLTYVTLRDFYSGDRNDMLLSTLEKLVKVIGQIRLG